MFLMCLYLKQSAFEANRKPEVTRKPATKGEIRN